MSVCLCVSSWTHIKSTRKIKQLWLSLQLVVPCSSGPTGLNTICVAQFYSELSGQLPVVCCPLPVATDQSPVSHCQLPVLSWQPLLCFVNRLRHFCLPYALRDDLLDKASSSDKQDCFGLSGVGSKRMANENEQAEDEDVRWGWLKGAWQVVVAMWPSQIVYRLSVCSFVARAINSDHTGGWRKGNVELRAGSSFTWDGQDGNQLMSWLCFSSLPNLRAFATSPGISLVCLIWLAA